MVAYYHEWSPESIQGAGEFVYWDKPGQTHPTKVMPYPRAGSAVDGSKTVHAADIYRRDVDPPVLSKDAVNELTFVSGEDWILTSSDKPDTTKYKTEDLRMSVVYRARCFRDATEAAKFDGGKVE